MDGKTQKLKNEFRKIILPKNFFFKFTKLLKTVDVTIKFFHASLNATKIINLKIFQIK